MSTPRCREADVGHPWRCCAPITARGADVGGRRQVYALHAENCPAPTWRRQTVTLWAEVPHLTFKLRERWPAA
jgi:hypothetical protein